MVELSNLSQTIQITIKRFSQLEYFIRTDWKSIILHLRQLLQIGIFPPPDLHLITGNKVDMPQTTTMSEILSYYLPLQKWPHHPTSPWWYFPDHIPQLLVTMIAGELAQGGLPENCLVLNQKAGGSDMFDQLIYCQDIQLYSH